LGRPRESPLLGSATNAATIYAIPRVLRNRLPEAARLQRLTRASQLADWPNVAVRFKMLIKRRVGLTLGLGRSLMHGVAPQMCGRVASPLLGRGAGGRSPGYLMPARLAAWAQMLLQLVSEREERGFSDWFADVDTSHRAVVCALTGLDAKRL
jgi:hypothetical protein